MELVGVGNRR